MAFLRKSKNTLNPQHGNFLVKRVVQQEIKNERMRIGNERMRIGNERMRIGNERMRIGNERMRIGNERMRIGNERMRIGNERMRIGNDNRVMKKINVIWRVLLTLLSSPQVVSKSYA